MENESKVSSLKKFVIRNKVPFIFAGGVLLGIAGAVFIERQSSGDRLGVEMLDSDFLRSRADELDALSALETALEVANK